MPAAPSVLFVDDDAHVLAGIALTLRHRAFRVLTAASAREGLACLDQEPVSVAGSCLPTAAHIVNGLTMLPILACR